MGSQRSITAGWIYAAAGVLLAIAIISAFAFAQTPNELANLCARYTARISFLMFVCVAVSGPASRIWRGSFWIDLARQRRHIGLAFAALMLCHFVAVAINLAYFNPRPLSESVLGVPIYMMIVLLALTSNQAAQRRLGKWWKRLHWIGVTAVLLAFTESYSSRLFHEGYEMIGVVFAPIALAVIAIRIADVIRKRRA